MPRPCPGKGENPQQGRFAVGGKKGTACLWEGILRPSVERQEGELEGQGEVAQNKRQTCPPVQKPSGRVAGEQ